jgi:hypothetical protein
MTKSKHSAIPTMTLILVLLILLLEESGSDTLLSHSGLLNLFKAITGIEGIAYRAVVNHSSVET